MNWLVKGTHTAVANLPVDWLRLLADHHPQSPSATQPQDLAAHMKAVTVHHLVTQPWEMVQVCCDAVTLKC